MGAVRSCPQCGNRKCVSNRDKLVTREVNESEGLPAPLLRKKLHDAINITNHMALDLAEGHLDISTASALQALLDALAFQALVVQACLVSTIFGMDSTQVPLTPRVASASWSHDTATISNASYHSIRSDGIGCLKKMGELFEALAPTFQEHAFSAPGKPKSWGPRQVDVEGKMSAKTGKGYLNTFKDDQLCETNGGGERERARATAFTQRLERFLGNGGSLDDIIQLKPISQSFGPQVDILEQTSISSISKISSPGKVVSENPTSPEEVWEELVPGEWYDYVVSSDNRVRCYPITPTVRQKRPKCGHTLLAGAMDLESTFKDEPVVMAGDLCCLKGATGSLEILLITTNSGHFKPKNADLPNAIPAFEKLGLSRSNICLFGGPNSIVAFRLALAEGASIEALGRVIAGETMLNPYAMVAQWVKQR